MVATKDLVTTKSRVRRGASWSRRRSEQGGGTPLLKDSWNAAARGVDLMTAGGGPEDLIVRAVEGRAIAHKVPDPVGVRCPVQSIQPLQLGCGKYSSMLSVPEERIPGAYPKLLPKSPG